VVVGERSEERRREAPDRDREPERDAQAMPTRFGRYSCPITTSTLNGT